VHGIALIAKNIAIDRDSIHMPEQRANDLIGNNFALNRKGGKPELADRFSKKIREAVLKQARIMRRR
jgi:hypothetical protein